MTNDKPKLTPRQQQIFELIQRAIARMPKNGSKAPWRMHQNYARDLLGLQSPDLGRRQR